MIEWYYERHWLRDYERHILNENMRDTDGTRLWETLIKRDYERQWLNQTIKGTLIEWDYKYTDWTRLWEALIERYYERYWID